MIKNKFVKVFTALLLYIAFFTGCGGGGASGVSGVDAGTDAGIKLEISGFYFGNIAVETAPDMIKAGFPVRVRASIDASEEVDNLVVSYSLIDSYGTSRFIGSDMIDHVDYGAGSYETTLLLPDDIRENDYKIIGFLDPSGKILSDTYESLRSPQADISIKSNDGEPGIAVVNFNPDIDVILFEDKTDTRPVSAAETIAGLEEELDIDLSGMEDVRMLNEDMASKSALPKGYNGPKTTGTIVVTSYGSDAQNVPVSACLSTPAGCVPMLIWDSASQSYVKSIVMGSIKKNVPTHAYLEMVLPQDRVSDVTSFYNLSEPMDSSVIISVNRDGQIRESDSDTSVRTAALSPNVSFVSGDDNSISSRVSMYSPAVSIQAVGNCNYSGYDDGFGVGSNTDTGISAGIDYGAGTTLCDDNMESGAYVAAPVSFYGSSFDVVDADINAVLTYATSSAMINYSLYLFEGSGLFQIQIFDDSVTLPTYMYLANSPIFEAYVNEDASFSKTFWVAYVVPITVEAGVGIELGVNGSLVAMALNSYYPTGMLYGSIIPYANVYAWASGFLGTSFDIFGYEVSTPQAGGTVDVSLIEYQLPVFAAGRFFIYQNALRGYTYFTIAHNIKGLSGEFYLWAQYWGPSDWPNCSDVDVSECFDNCDTITNAGDLANCVIAIVTGPFCMVVEVVTVCEWPTLGTQRAEWPIFDWNPLFDENQILYYRFLPVNIPL